MRSPSASVSIAALALLAAGCSYIARGDVSATGTPADAPAHRPALSFDGRWMVYDSAATNLAAGDANAAPDVFRRDNRTGAIDLVSRAIGGGSGNGASVDATVSGDGQTVAFTSYASDLVPGDTNGLPDVFVWHAGQITRVSQTDVAQANGGSFEARISADGRWVAFTSTATNLAPGLTSHQAEVFRWSVSSTPHASELVSPPDASSSQPTIDGDGQTIAYVTTLSGAGTTHQIAVHDGAHGGTNFTITGDAAEHTHPSISADGFQLAYTVTANGRSDVDVAVLQLSCPYPPFCSLMLAGVVPLTDGANASSWTSGRPSVATGAGSTLGLVAFTTAASNLGPTDTRQDTNGSPDVVIADRPNVVSPVPDGPLFLEAARSSAGVEGDHGSDVGALSGDGHYVAFESSSTNLGGAVGPAAPAVFVTFALANPGSGGALDPATVPRGATSVSLIVRGTNLAPSGSPRVDAGAGVTVRLVEFELDPSKPGQPVVAIVVDVSTTAATGSRDVTITYPPTTAGLPTAQWRCAACLTIT